MKSLQDLDIFVRTVDSGSLSATARALDLTPAAASAALKRLEAELGVALFVRSTRSLRLTQEGALFLEHCRPALAALQQVHVSLEEAAESLGATKLRSIRRVVVPLMASAPPLALSPTTLLSAKVQANTSTFAPSFVAGASAAWAFRTSVSCEAAMPAPTRPPTMSAVSAGPSSRSCRASARR